MPKCSAPGTAKQGKLVQPIFTIEPIVAHPQSILYAVRRGREREGASGDGPMWISEGVAPKKGRAVPLQSAPSYSFALLEAGSGQLAVEHGPSEVKILCRLAPTGGGGGDDAPTPPSPIRFVLLWSSLVDSVDEPMRSPVVVPAGSPSALLGFETWLSGTFANHVIA